MSLEILHRDIDDSVFVNQTVRGTRDFRFIAENNEFASSLRSTAGRLRFHVGGYGCGEKTIELGKPDMTGTKLDGTIMEFFFLGDIPMAGYDKMSRQSVPGRTDRAASVNLVLD